MTNRVIQGTYEDAKFIKSRSVLQIHVEIPIEHADNFFELFGSPKPNESQWVALAVLEPSAANARAHTAMKSERSTKAIQACGIACNDPNFGTWLRDYRGMSTIDPNNQESVANALRAILGCKSRTEMHNDDALVQRWWDLKKAYDEYVFG